MKEMQDTITAGIIVRMAIRYKKLPRFDVKVRRLKYHPRRLRWHLRRVR